MNFCHGQKTSEILITLGKFLCSVLPPLTCGVHEGNCIVLSPQFCSSYFLNPLLALYHNAASRETVSLFVTECHDSKKPSFLYNAFLQRHVLIHETQILSTIYTFTYNLPSTYIVKSKTTTFLLNGLPCLLIMNKE